MYNFYSKVVDIVNRKHKVIISIIGITIVMLALLGITYAYYLTRIEGNTNTNSISITTSKLELLYSDGNKELNIENLIPGQTIAKKTFSVENTGNDLIEYGVFLENVINELKYYDDLIFTITCTSESLDNSVIPTPNSCSGVTDYQFPLTNEEILTNTIEAKVKHNYV